MKLSTAQQVIELFRNLSDDDKALIASRSYKHPGGFYKIVLHENADDKSSIRLHLWQFPLPVRENPHSHAWRFTSHVLSGGLKDTHWTECDSKCGEPYTKYRVDITKENHSCNVEFIGPVRLSATGAFDRTAPTTYTLEADVVHSSGPSEDDTITLVHQAARTRTENELYCDHQPLTFNVGEPTKYTALSSSELNVLIERIVNILSKQI